MEKAVYLISIKNTQDKWLPTKSVYVHSKLLRIIQNRLLPHFSIYSAPICECVQYAGLVSTHNIITINLIEALNRKYSSDFESGLPSSLQSTSLASLEISGFVSPDHFHQIFEFLYSQESNSIIFVPQDLTHWFSAFTELRLDNEDLTVYRVYYSLSTKLVIKSCVFRKKHWKIKISTVKKSRSGACELVLSETGQVLCQVPKFRSRMTLVVYPKEYKREIRAPTETLVCVKSLVDLRLADKKVHCEKEGEKISNFFYVPEYLVDAGLVDGFWMCRIVHQGEKQHDLIRLVSGKYEQDIDCSGIPANDTILIKVLEKNIGSRVCLCIKIEEKLCSNLFTYVQDQIEDLGANLD